MLPLSSPTGGGIAALLAALVWALAATLFARLGRRLPAVEINILKGTLAMVLLAITLYLGGGSLVGIPGEALWLLMVSGVAGITLGETAYLKAIQTLGPRRTLLMSTLAPPMVGLIAWGFLGEALKWTAWLGILVTVGGVAWVILERSPNHNHHPANLKLGLLFGFLAALAQSAALVLSRAALTRTTVDSLSSAVVRLFAGVVILAVWSLAARRPLVSLGVFKAQPRLWGLLLSATILGTYLAIWLQQVSISLAPAGIAQTLMSTSPIFILPIAAMSGEKLSPRAVLGALVALAGVWLLFGV